MRSLFIATLALLLVGCSQSTKPVVIADSGTVHYQNVEGGFWGILGDGGGKYDVVQGLPADMQVDGLRVHFVARPSSSQVSFHMWGQRIDIETIDRLE
jgi:inhibitor of cysteine peptidase